MCGVEGRSTSGKSITPQQEQMVQALSRQQNPLPASPKLKLSSPYILDLGSPKNKANSMMDAYSDGESIEKRKGRP